MGSNEFFLLGRGCSKGGGIMRGGQTDFQMRVMMMRIIVANTYWVLTKQLFWVYSVAPHNTLKRVTNIRQGYRCDSRGTERLDDLPHLR